MSVAIIVSRITGFIRTWAMAYALGHTVTSGAYQAANNLPNLLYEMVIGGLLVTAFLPVYMDLKKNRGPEAASKYASNLLSITGVFLAVVAIVCTIFAPQIMSLQTFMSDDPEVYRLATFFFMFFAIQVLFYGMSAIFSGLLNAERDYVKPAIAPIFNNLVTIATFIGYVFIVKTDAQMALVWLAVGTSLGVFIQAATQLPSIRKQGISLRFHIDLKDPGLIATLKLGIPAIIVTAASSVAVFMQSASALGVDSAGTATMAYARLWYTLPHSFLVIPITTVLFTELSDHAAGKDFTTYVRTLNSGVKQIIFLIVPFAAFLAIFAVPLATIYRMGAFTQEGIESVSTYLMWLAPALPFFSFKAYLVKVCSSLGKMLTYAIIDVIALSIQVLIMFPLVARMGLPGIAVAEVIGNALCVFGVFAWLRWRFGKGFHLGVRTLVRTLGITVVGLMAGGGVLYALDCFITPFHGSIPIAFVYVVISGIVALLGSYGLSIMLGMEESRYIRRVLGAVLGKFGLAKKKREPVPEPTSERMSEELPPSGNVSEPYRHRFKE